MGFNIYLGAFLTLDACRFNSVQYFTFSLGILTWSTQLTKSNTIPKVVTTKIDSGYICSRHAQDQYCSLSFHQMVTIIDFQVFFLLTLVIIYIMRWWYFWHFSGSINMSSHQYHSTMSEDTYMKLVCPSSQPEEIYHGFYHFQRLNH